MKKGKSQKIESERKILNGEAPESTGHPPQAHANEEHSAHNTNNNHRIKKSQKEKDHEKDKENVREKDKDKEKDKGKDMDKGRQSIREKDKDKDKDKDMDKKDKDAKENHVTEKQKKVTGEQLTLRTEAIVHENGVILNGDGKHSSEESSEAEPSRNSNESKNDIVNPDEDPTKVEEEQPVIGNHSSSDEGSPILSPNNSSPPTSPSIFGRDQSADDLLASRRLDVGQASSSEKGNYLETIPWFCDADLSIHPLTRLHQEIMDFTQYISPTEAEHETRLYIIDRISTVIMNLWPCATVKIFGSFETQLYLPTSDIDMVVLFEWPKDAPPPLHRLASEIEKAHIAEQIKILDKARVPIIKVKESVVGFDVDISFNIKNGIEAAELIKEKLIDFPAVKPLAFVIKQFLLQRNLNEVFTGGLSSYSVVCLIISFLQMHPKLRPETKKGEANLGVLLIQFFELYGKKFNYKNVAISIRDSGSYYKKMFPTNLLSIEDPQDPGNDITSSSFNFSYVKSLFEAAYDVLGTAVTSSPTPESLLGKIVEISRNVLETRAKIIQVYNNISSQRKESD